MNEEPRTRMDEEPRTTHVEARTVTEEPGEARTVVEEPRASEAGEEPESTEAETRFRR
jgi:hypothetical protein